MSSATKYCPILGRRVKIKSECEDKKKEMARDVAVCQTEKKVCNGNCQGCSML